MIDWFGRWHYEPNIPDEKKCDLDRLADAVTAAGYVPDTDMENLCCMVYAHFECAIEDREYGYEDTFEDLQRYVEDSGGYSEFDYWC